MQDGKFVILHVDDDDDLLEIIKVVLESGDYVVVQAGSGEEGLRKYKQAQPDLIIADLMMEEVDAGTNFVKELKALGNTAPIFMLSSVGDGLSQNINYAELGLAGVFQKPIEPNVLLKTIEYKLTK